jgi:hypothetical protein
MLARMLAWLVLQGCKEGCLTGADAECVVPSPCEGLTTTCDGGSVRSYVLKPGDPLPVGGPDALASPGDIVLESDRVVAVIDALDHPHYVGPSGGSLLDFAPVGGQDGLRNILQATGLLPGDAIHYTSYELLDEDGVAAVQFKGSLDGHPEITAATRYELRPCEDGIRIRTEIVNREPDPYPLFLVDGFYWGGREHLPFTPGDGFDHPSFGLTTIPDALRSVPWMSAGGHASAASYGVTGCSSATIDGFQSAELSAMGPPKRVLMPRDYEVYERFVAVADGPSVSGPADVLAVVREKLRGERSVELSGAIGGSTGTMAVATVQVEGPDGWATSVVPGPDGRFHAKVPPDADYTLHVESFGKDVAQFPAEVKGDDLDVGTLSVPAVGEVDVSGTLDGLTHDLLVFVHPSDEADEDALSGALYGQWDTCAPLLGNPYGPSPACNRVLAGDPTPVLLPAGTYDFFAAAGPFGTLAHVGDVVVTPGSKQAVELDVRTLPIQPAGTLSGDFHVHGRQSFDSQLPDLDRIRALLAARVQVVASTDHDVVNDYADAVATLGAADQMKLLIGLETTGHILFPLVETTIYPKVIGHFIFWPLPYDPEGAWRGAPWDELAEPGELFDRVKAAGMPDSGVIQLNHPWGGLQFGRDFAWPTAIGLDLTKPLPETYDGTGQGLFLRTPPGATSSNAGYDVEEVMNGSSNENFLQYRAVWHYLLNQGVVRAGTANSDSHSLTDNVLGTPRNVVWTDATMADWDEPTFDASVKAGTILGTNGPIVIASTTDATGHARTPSVTAFQPDESASLKIDVTAAPWVPVEEVRIVVNGAVVKTLTPTTVAPADPFGTDGVARLSTSVPLSEILPASGDAWIVVEAGAPLMEEADLDCNGVPDTGDNNGDGRIDWKDVEELTEDPGAGCLDTVGPLKDPPRPPWGTPGFFFERVTPGGYPVAFTNPLLLDRDGGGYHGVAK